MNRRTILLALIVIMSSAALALMSCIPEPKTSLNLGTLVWAQVSGAKATFAESGQTLKVKFSLPAASDIVIVTEKSSKASLDTFIELYDLSDMSTLIASDDDNGSRLFSIIIRTLPVGTYTVKMTLKGSRKTGTIKVFVATFPPGDIDGNLGGLAAGGSASSGGTLLGGGDYSIFLVSFDDEASADINMTSGAFDAFLDMWNMKDDLSRSDDNSGTGTDARITDTFPMGTYFLMCQGASGAFIISVDVSP